MFVHSGAALHRHEYSAPLDLEPRSSSAPRRTSLSRPAFPSRRASTYDSPSPALARPQRPRPVSELPHRNTEAVVRFQPRESDVLSEDARSLATSDSSEVVSTGTRLRRRVRTSTTFHLAHPAPTLTQKQRLIHIRPRLLLQLQRLSHDSRPEPAIDVLPSAVVIPRLSRKFPRMFRGKSVLGMNDVLLVHSEEYDSPDDAASEAADSDEEGLANRDMIAVVCQMPKDAGGSQGKAEIVLRDGSVWVATPQANGLYEFVTVDANGNKTTARWVRRSTRRNSVDFSCPAPASTSTPFKYTFSIIDPNSRRHPIMGTLTQNTLDIPDFYTSVSSSVKKHPPTSHIRPMFAEHDSMDDEPAPERATHAVQEDVKRLIQVTGIWVALREGLSPHFKYSDSMANGSAAGAGRASHGRARSVSLTPELSGRAGMAASCCTSTSTPDSAGHGTRAGVAGKLRRACTSGPVPVVPVAPTTPQVEALKAPQRSTSAGTAFMQRVAARKTWRPPSTVPSDSDAESGPRRPRRSTTEYSRTVSTPPPPATLPRSSTTTPETPTRLQRRVQSAYYVPSNLPQTMEGTPARHSVHDVKVDRELDGDVDVDLDLDWVVKPKTSRWRQFTNLFRRSHARTA